MPEKNVPVLAGLFKSLEGVTDAVVIRKGILAVDHAAILKEITDADVAPVRDAVAEAWKMLRDLADKGSIDTPSSDGVAAGAPVAPDAQSVLASAELQKALGADGVSILRKAFEQSEQIVKELEAEREATFIAKARTDYGTIMDADTIEPFAKGLRALTALDPTSAAAVTAALAKSMELNASAESIITSELGSAYAPAGSGADRLNSIAKSLFNAGSAPTIEQAYAKAVELNPALYDALKTESK